jgi:predicted  nucleic acid-binding Zn-ribbon protein
VTEKKLPADLLSRDYPLTSRITELEAEVNRLHEQWQSNWRAFQNLQRDNLSLEEDNRKLRESLKGRDATIRTLSTAHDTAVTRERQATAIAKAWQRDYEHACAERDRAVTRVEMFEDVLTRVRASLADQPADKEH